MLDPSGGDRPRGGPGILSLLDQFEPPDDGSV
jgi:hypothetical protein